MPFDQDSKIIRRVKNGDAELFAELYDKYVEAIYRFVFFKVPSRQDAEDLTSQAFMKVLEYCLDGGRRIKNLRALLYCTARNLVTDFYRLKSREELPLNEEAGGGSGADAPRQSGAGIGDKIEVDLNMRRVMGALKRLKEEYREAIVLHYLDELSVGEISGILNKSGGATRVLIHRALGALRAAVNEQESANNNQ